MDHTQKNQKLGFSRAKLLVFCDFNLRPVASPFSNKEKGTEPSFFLSKSRTSLISFFSSDSLFGEFLVSIGF